jgi:hypothetical protein
MTAPLAPDMSAPDLTDEQRSWDDLLIGALVGLQTELLNTERDLAVVSGELRRLRRERAALGVGDSWVLGL